MEDNELGEKQDQNFDDSELKEIMSEIEILEEEFSNDESLGEDEVVNEVVASATEEEVCDDPISEVSLSEVVIEEEVEVESDNIVPLEVASEAILEEENILPGHLSLNFSLGSQKFQCEARGNEGFTIRIEDLTISVDSADLCVVEIKNGAKFVVPLKSLVVNKESA